MMCYLNDGEASLAGVADVPLETLVTKEEHDGKAQQGVAIILSLIFELRIRLVST
jgi:hypothetical protein